MIKAISVSHSITTSERQLHILNTVNLQINSGESVAIVGASGSGKSTLLGMLAGLDCPTSGEIYINDEEITHLNEDQKADIRNRYISFVFQNFQLLDSLTAIENVMLPLEIRNASNAREKALSFLNRVGLADRANHYPKQLSGGEQQRVALARAFITNAPVLFADEPTGNLDTDTGKQIADLMFHMNQESKTTLVLVTHDQQLANRCQRQLRMTAGNIAEEAV